jgi:hypothetical protein
VSRAKALSLLRVLGLPPKILTVDITVKRYYNEANALGSRLAALLMYLTALAFTRYDLNVACWLHGILDLATPTVDLCT